MADQESSVANSINEIKKLLNEGSTFITHEKPNKLKNMKKPGC